MTGAGPLLDDATFFGELIDTARPGLEGVPAAVARGDFAAARRLFAAEARRSLQPERLLGIPRSFVGFSNSRPGETAEEAAERALRLELISCGTPHQFVGEVDWFANPTANGYREWTWQLSRHGEWAILGQRYRATGDERFAAGGVALFRSWVRQAVAPEVGVPGGETLCWRTIEAGLRMGGAWPYALHACYRSPHFTDDVLIDWYKSVWEHGQRLRHDHRTHNWLIMEMNGLAQIGILYPQFRAAAAWRDYAFARLAEELDRQLYPDGLQFELSTNYHQVVIRNYETLRDVCDAYDVPVPPAFDAHLERAHAANLCLMQPDGLLPDLNDSFRWPVADLLAGAARRYPARADFRWAASAGREGAPPAETSLAFPYGGLYVMRTGWGQQDLWACFDGGPFGFAHQHEDKLNLLLHAYGRTLLTEGGNYAYDDSEMRRYVISTRSHNTIRVDGRDQDRWSGYDRDDPGLLSRLADARWRTTPDYDVAEATYDEGYSASNTAAAARWGRGSGVAPDRTVAHRRRVICLKRGVGAIGPCMLVIDRLLPTDDAPHDYEALWHMEAGAAIAEGVIARSVEPGAANLAVIPAPRRGLTLAILTAQTEPEWQGWRSPLHEHQGTELPCPTATYRWRATGPARLVTLLYPTPPGEECPVVAVAADAGVEATGFTLTLANGTAIALDEATYPL